MLQEQHIAVSCSKSVKKRRGERNQTGLFSPLRVNVIWEWATEFLMNPQLVSFLNHFQL